MDDLKNMDPVVKVPAPAFGVGGQAVYMADHLVNGFNARDAYVRIEAIARVPDGWRYTVSCWVASGSEPTIDGGRKPKNPRKFIWDAAERELAKPVIPWGRPGPSSSAA